VASTLYLQNDEYAFSSSNGESRPVIYRYDATGNMKYSEQVKNNDQGLRITYYRYLSFDAEGNWTRREVFTDRLRYKPDSVETRVIKYH
jgi:hypothetical protein